MYRREQPVPEVRTVESNQIRYYRGGVTPEIPAKYRDYQMLYHHTTAVLPGRNVSRQLTKLPTLLANMPIINWNVAAANKFAFLRLIFFSSVRSFPAIIRYALDQTPLSLRNSLARAWLGTTFEQLPQLLYSEPPAHGLEKIDRESFNTYLVPKCDVSSLKHADGVVMFFHGGGMILGHPLQYLDAYERWAATAAKSGRRLVFVAVQYRTWSLRNHLVSASG